MELDFRAGISLTALCVSGASMWLGIRNWRQSNRPIVAVFLRTVQSGNVGTAFEIVLANAGTRPATHVQLTCDREKYRAALSEPEPKGPLLDGIERCFEPSRYVPVLLSGDSTSNAFGAVSARPGDGTWRVNASFPVVVTYRNPEGRRFQNEWDIVIRDTETFAGSGWSKK